MLEERIVLVVGATGRTGRHVVRELLDEGYEVRIIARSPDKLAAEILSHQNLRLIEGSVLNFTDQELAACVRGCRAIVSCLGHVFSFDGIFGAPQLLCTEATRRLCEAVDRNGARSTTKFVLMNSIGVDNPKRQESRSWLDRGVINLLSNTVPVQRDNEMAARYLALRVGESHPQIQWCVVRPDSLVDEDVSSYLTESEPTAGLFSARPTSRSNVAHFMKQLVTDDQMWAEWRFQMPVLSNRSDAGAVQA